MVEDPEPEEAATEARDLVVDMRPVPESGEGVIMPDCARCDGTGSLCEDDACRKHNEPEEECDLDCSNAVTCPDCQGSGRV